MVKNLPPEFFPPIPSISKHLFDKGIKEISCVLSLSVAGMLIALLLLLPARVLAANELPSPTPNIETIPAGSWIIAMDNTNQGISGIMNLKAYGLAVELLHASIPLKWIIKSGKSKDE